MLAFSSLSLFTSLASNFPNVGFAFELNSLGDISAAFHRFKKTCFALC